MNLMGADTLFRGRQQEQRRQPFRQRELAALEYGLDRDCELFAAAVALIDAPAMGFAIEGGHVLTRTPAMRANRAIRPDPNL